MSFDISNLQVKDIPGLSEFRNAVFELTDLSTTLADIANAAYWDELDAPKALRTGDVIIVFGSDGHTVLVVTSRSNGHVGVTSLYTSM